MNILICRDAFLDLFEEIYNVNLQNKLWLNINNESNLVSSYSELMNSLDSGDFVYVIENLIKSNDLKSDLRLLLEMLNDYEEPSEYWKDYMDVHIVEDINWKRIQKFAAHINEKYRKSFDELKRLEKC